MARVIGGNAYFVIDGRQYSTSGDFTVKIQDRKATAVVASSGEVFYTEEAVPGTIAGNLFTTPDLDTNTVTAIRDATVTVELKNGQVAVLSHAVFTGDGSVKSKDGTMEVEFAGNGRWT
jgi:Phage tail tube protein